MTQTLQFNTTKKLLAEAGQNLLDPSRSEMDLSKFVMRIGMLLLNRLTILKPWTLTLWFQPTGASGVTWRVPGMHYRRHYQLPFRIPVPFPLRKISGVIS